MAATVEDWWTTLRREFEADEGSFLQIAQSEARWDKAAFRDLVEAMRECCIANAEMPQLPRWMALGFFYVPAFVRAWTQQPDFERPAEAYWQRAIELLEILSHWFFWGEPPTRDGGVDVLNLE
jgi:hypothetical protein